MITTKLLFVFATTQVICTKAKTTTFNYTLDSISLKSISPLDIKHRKFDIRLEYEKKFDLDKYVKTYQRSMSQTKIFPSVTNLRPLYKTLSADRCLIVINNFQGTDIHPIGFIPIILRQFELFIVRTEYKIRSKKGRHAQIIWAPRKYIHNLIGSFNKAIGGNEEYRDVRNCPISKIHNPFVVNLNRLYYSSGFCVEFDQNLFSSSSKLWNCEIQTELYMPEYTLGLSKYTKIFSSFKIFAMPMTPTSWPKINILVDSKQNLSNYNAFRLLIWYFQPADTFFKDTEISYSNTNVLFTSYLACKRGSLKAIGMHSCNVGEVHIISPCLKCKLWLKSTSVNSNSLTMKNILWFEQIRSLESFPGKLQIDNYSFSYEKLTRFIERFWKSEEIALRKPLSNLFQITSKYSDNMKMLAFGYASLYSTLLGNVTSEYTEFNIRYNNGKSLLRISRVGKLSDIPFSEQVGLFQIENHFETLRFLSCGYMGLEAFPLLKFISVFESSVWKWIAFTTLLLLFCIMNLTGRTRNVVNSYGLLCLLKVMLEQGDPFPLRLTKLNRFRFIICSTLLAGVVISNAFKSTNVYNIVKPRHMISYKKMNELVQDNFTTYIRVTEFYYNFDQLINANFPQIKPNIPSDKLSFMLFNKQHLIFAAKSEIYEWMKVKVPPSVVWFKELEKVQNAFRTVIGNRYLFNLLLEPLEVLAPLVRVGILSRKALSKLSFQSHLNSNFWRKQNQFIFEDLKNCTKTSWILPEYLAYPLSKRLRTLGLHSDVGVDGHFKPQILFKWQGLVPGPLVKRIAMLQHSGLFKWWQNFVNRTDVGKVNNVETPQPPNMKGNIQLLFIFLLGGLSVALVSLILELRYVLFKYCKVCFNFFFCFVRKALLRLRLCLKKLLNVTTRNPKRRKQKLRPKNKKPKIYKPYSFSSTNFTT